MKRTLNKNSITLKINSVQYNESKYENKEDTELKHDALYLLLISANPLRSEYNFDGKDSDSIYKEIEELKNKMNDLLLDAKHLLLKTKKTNLYY
tara:strand:- start:953 stop:1234 length:282 start_codon:yes stop_codon:yes gene_type:complete